LPIYEYTCEQCHEKQEIIQKVNEPAPEACPKCHAKGFLKKAVTSSSFHLKGGGWYKDLYASQKKPEQAASTSTKDAAAPVSEKADKPAKKED